MSRPGTGAKRSLLTHRRKVWREVSAHLRPGRRVRWRREQYLMTRRQHWRWWVEVSHIPEHNSEPCPCLIPDPSWTFGSSGDDVQRVSAFWWLNRIRMRTLFPRGWGVSIPGTFGWVKERRESFFRFAPAPEPGVAHATRLVRRFGCVSSSLYSILHLCSCDSSVTSYPMMIGESNTAPQKAASFPSVEKRLWTIFMAQLHPKSMNKQTRWLTTGDVCMYGVEMCASTAAHHIIDRRSRNGCPCPMLACTFLLFPGNQNSWYLHSELTLLLVIGCRRWGDRRQE